MKLNARIADLLVAGFAAVVLGAGCTSSSTEVRVKPIEPDGESVEIVLNAGVTLSSTPDAPAEASLPETRAIINAVHKALPLSVLRLDAKDAAPTYPDYKDGTLLKAELAEATTADADKTSTTGITFKKADGTTTERQNYLTSGYKTKLIAWYPQVSDAPADAVTFSTTDGSVTFKVDGASDIMLSDEKVGSKANGDLFSGNKDTSGNADAATDKTKVLAFAHLLTQIKVSAYAVDTDAQTAWGKITEIKLKDQGGKTCKITLPGTAANSIAFTAPSTLEPMTLVKKKVADDTQIEGDTAGSEYSKTNGLTIPVATTDASGAITAKNDTQCGYAMFEPLLPADDGSTTKLTLLVSTEKATDWEVDLSLPKNGGASGDGFLKSVAYTIVLRFTAKEITPSGQITDWVDHEWPTGDDDFKGEIEL